MPMRNRRIRLLVLAVLIAFTFLLYSRSDPTTIEEAKQIAKKTYQNAIDQTQHAIDQTQHAWQETIGKQKQGSINVDTPAPAADVKKDEPFRVDFSAYNKAAGVDAVEPERKPPLAAQAPFDAKPMNPIVSPPPKKDDPMRVDFAAYSTATAAPEMPALAGLLKNPNPIAGAFGVNDKPAAAPAKPTPDVPATPDKDTAKAAAVPDKDIGKANVPPIGRPDSAVAPIGEGRVSVDVDATQTAAPVHWTKLVERFAPTSTIAYPFNTGKAIPKIQYDFKTKQIGADAEKRAAIKAMAEHTWKGYKEKAMGHDEVTPISGKYANPFNNWGATLIDALDTLWLMGMVPEFEDAVKQVEKIDFTTSRRADIPLFETTIRYMGGLLGGYEISSRHYQPLLDQAAKLGEILYGAFDTPNRMPMTYYQWKPAYASQGHRAPVRTVMSELGSLGIEFTRLGQLTNATRYYDAIARITDALEEYQMKTRLPGLWPAVLDASGCKKPASSEDEYNFSNGKGPSAPLPKYPDSNPVKPPSAEEKSKQSSSGVAVGGKEPGIGKIANFGKPAEEGSLDSPAAKSSVLQNGRDILKRAFDDVKAGVSSISDGVSAKMNQIADSAPVKSLTDGLSAESGLTSSSKEETRSSSQTPITDEAPCVPQGLASTAVYGSDIFTFGAAADSTYEYLPKMYMLLGGRVEQYATMYKKAITSAKKHLLYRAMIPDEKREIYFIGNMDIKPNTGSGDVKMEETFSALGSHLTCFVGGMFAMGGKIFESAEDVDIGRKLTEGCIWAYNATASGIMPELFGMHKCDSMTSCKWDEKAYHQSLDPYEEFRMSHAKSRSSGLSKRQYGGGEMQYGINTAPEQVPPESALRFSESPPLAFGQHGMPKDAPALVDTPAVARPNDAAPKLPSDSKAVQPGGAINAEPYPAAPDALAKPAEKPVAAEPKKEAPLPIEKKLEPPVPGSGVAPTVPDTGSTSPEKKLSPDVPGTGIAPTLSDKGKDAKTPDFKLTPEGRIPVGSNVKVPATSDSFDNTVPANKPGHKSTDSADAAEEEALSHADYVKNKIRKERLPTGMVGIYDRKYQLRPEAIESVFYMYRITGEQYWRDVGWQMWLAISKHTKAPYGANTILDVTEAKPEAQDTQESFWMAETLKYFYLLFDDPERYSLDDWVLNTEAHFFSRLGA